MKPFSKNIIVRFLDGKLSPEEENSLLSRKSVIARMKQQWNLQSGDVSAFDQNLILRKVESRIERNSLMARRRITFIKVASIAASILLVMGIGYLWFYQRTTSDNEVMMLAHETQTEERLQVTLPDSTIVWLNAGSRIEYPEVFEPAVRQVKLSGEAYFDVTHRAKQPFYVQTDKLLIRVLGTQFTVSDYQKETSAEAVLISGKVNANVLRDSIGRTFELLPNEQLIFDERQQYTAIQKVDASQYTDWIHGKLYFDNAGLGYIISKLEHWYGKKIECSRELSAGYRLTFTVRNESFEQIIRLMQNIAPISFQPAEGHYLVVAKTLKQ